MDPAPTPSLPTDNARDAFRRACAARAELIDRCFRQYAQAMLQMGDALDQYRTVLADGPRWSRAA